MTARGESAIFSRGAGTERATSNESQRCRICLRVRLIGGPRMARLAAIGV